MRKTASLLHMDGHPCRLIMENSQNYVLVNENGRDLVRIIRRGLTGGWNVSASGRFRPEMLCGLFALCRYMEQENEMILV